MRPVRQELLSALLQRATEESLGLVVTTNNARAMLQQLQVIKRDMQLDDLMLCTPSIENVVFIVRKSVELD